MTGQPSGNCSGEPSRVSGRVMARMPHNPAAYAARLADPKTIQLELKTCPPFRKPCSHPRNTWPANARPSFAASSFAAKCSPWPERLGHTLVKDNVAGETRNQLKDGKCRVLTSDLRIKITATGLYTYPDIVVVCDQPRFEDNVLDTLLNPRTLVQVLSHSSEKYDRGTKFAHYRQIPSVQEYVLIAQDRPLVERYVRQPDDDWTLTVFSDMTQTFAFGTIPVQIPLAEIYRGVEFPESVNR